MCVTGAPDEGWPFYCLALAWANARAWGVHGDRVRSRPGWASQFASTIHTPTTIAHSTAATSGTVSSAMSSSSESDNDTAKSNMGDGESSGADWVIVD